MVLSSNWCSLESLGWICLDNWIMHFMISVLLKSIKKGKYFFKYFPSKNLLSITLSVVVSNNKTIFYLSKNRCFIFRFDMLQRWHHIFKNISSFSAILKISSFTVCFTKVITWIVELFVYIWRVIMNRYSCWDKRICSEKSSNWVILRNSCQLSIRISNK